MLSTPNEFLSGKNALRIAQVIREVFAPITVGWTGAASPELAATLESFGIASSPESQSGNLAICVSESDDAILFPQAIGATALLVLITQPDAKAARARWIRAAMDAGWLPDFAADLAEIPVEALCFRPASAMNESRLVAGAESALQRMRERLLDLDQRLSVRLAQLDDAQLRLEEMQAFSEEMRKKASNWHKKSQASREEKDAWKARYKAMESSTELRVGTALLKPWRKVEKLGAKIQNFLKELSAPKVPPGEYHLWREQLRPSAEALAQQKETLLALSQRPTFALHTVVAEKEIGALSATAKSLLAQNDERWTWRLLAPQSLHSKIKNALGLLAKDSRVQLVGISENQSIPTALNQAIKADGDFISLLGAGDVLEPNALAEITLSLDEQPAEILYTDHDFLNAHGYFEDPFFKPDWSPDTFLSRLYFGKLTLIKTSLFQALNGFRDEADDAYEFDLLLRATEATQSIWHLAKMLCHSHSRDETPSSAGAKVLASALQRRGIAGTIERKEHGFRVKREIVEAKKITIIIPTRDRVELLARCIGSIEEKTDYANYEIVIVDNDSKEPATFEFYKSTRHRVLHYAGQFNYSAMNNYAAAKTDGDWLLLLNNDMEVINDDWLTEMASHIQRPEVGAVGAQLLYPDDTIQHAGVVLGVQGIGCHAFRLAKATDGGVHGQLQIVRNYSAVTGACLLTRRDVFERVGGLDEKNFAVNFNDVDLCLKIRALGLLVVYTPFAKLYHFESASRGRRYDNTSEVRVFSEKWERVLADDPCYNPNLSRDHEDFSWARPKKPKA